MRRSIKFRHHRTVGVATAALMSLGLLTACGAASSHSVVHPADSSDSASTHGSASAARTATGAGTSSSIDTKEDGGLLSGRQSSEKNFALDISGKRAETLDSVSGLAMDGNPVIYHVNGKGQIIIRKIPGQRSSGSVTVVRGTSRSALFNELISGKIKPISASVIVFNGGDIVERIVMRNPRVTKVASDGNRQTVTIHFAELSIE